jgi:hypothetical protein
MAVHLRDRLRRIQEHKNDTSQTVRQPSADISFFREQGWDSCGFLTLKREVIVKTQTELKAVLSPALMILIPDLARIAGTGKNLPEAEDFLFFFFFQPGFQEARGQRRSLPHSGGLSRLESATELAAGPAFYCI